jgi:hypothetical protein
MGLQHYSRYEQNTTKYHTNVLFYTKHTHPTLICRGTDARTDGRTDGCTDGRSENIYSIFRDKLLLLGEHVYRQHCPMWYVQGYFGSHWTPASGDYSLRIAAAAARATGKQTTINKCT